MGIIESPIFWIILAALSEILAEIPNENVQSNSVFQLLKSALNALLSSSKKGK
jgi:hypothetical protein|tara:strand:- start:1140 stop:1298 length:159 start_codon:yes stop_codon:yes gene_type:complete